MLSSLVGRMDSFTFVDVGSATGDAAALVRANYAAARTISVDRDFFHVSQGHGLRICGDAFRLPLPAGAADLVYCSLFLHHFTDDQVVALLREFRRVAARFILVSDLERHILAWGFIPATRWLFRWHPLTVHDGPVSVAAGFRAAEMLALAKRAGLGRAEVCTHRPAFRISLVAPVPHLLGDLIKKLKKQLKLTSIVVTHDMALAKKLADRLLFLHEARAIFLGPLRKWPTARSRSCRSSWS